MVRKALLAVCKSRLHILKLPSLPRMQNLEVLLLITCSSPRDKHKNVSGNLFTLFIRIGNTSVFE